MKLVKDQMDFYHENGYLVLEDLFSIEEIQAINSKLSQFNQIKDLPNIICEENGAIRSVFAPERHDELFAALYQNERVVEPCQQLVGDQIYLYQYKLNLKNAFDGKAWEWHQDFPYWKHGDGVEKPDLVSVMIYLNEVKAYQGPLLIIPRSHQFDIVAFEEKAHLQQSKELINDLGVDLRYTIRRSLISEMASRYGIKTLEFGPGTCIFFHPNLFHASTSNLSPYPRNTAIITYNNRHNLPQKAGARPSYICADDYTSLQALKGKLLTHQPVE